MVERKIRNGVYYCKQRHPEAISPDCPRTIGSKKADQIVWQKVCTAIDKPEILLAAARTMVNDLRAGASSLEAEQERIQKELDALVLERQWVITRARKGSISESDMDYQLDAITIQELSLKRELASVEQAMNFHFLGDWETKVREYLADLQAGLESLNADPQSDEDRREIFELKKQVVSTLVRRVTIDRHRELHVEISVDLLSLIENQSNDENAGGDSATPNVVGTYTRTQ